MFYSRSKVSRIEAPQNDSSHLNPLHRYTASWPSDYKRTRRYSSGSIGFPKIWSVQIRFNNHLTILRKNQLIQACFTPENPIVYIFPLRDDACLSSSVE